MRKVLIVPATFKPFEVAQIKLRPELRVAGSADDLIIADLLQSAVEAYEEYTDQILCLSTWDLYLDAFPDADGIETPAPLSSVTSISYLDSTGASQSLASSVYAVDTTHPLAGRIVLKSSQSWPAVIDQINCVTVRIVAGYANAASISQRIRDGLLAKVQEIYYGTDLASIYEANWRSYRRVHC